MSKQAVRDRAATAREHHQVAQERLALAPHGPSSEAQVSASNAILAAIAAADALCGRAHGRCSIGQDHREAATLLKAVPETGPRLAPKFVRLMSDKSDLTYGGFCTRSQAERATKDAGALVAELDRLSL